MLWFILGIVLFTIAIIWFSLAPGKQVREDYRGKKEIPSAKPLGVIPLGLALVFLVLSCFAVVGTRNVGVPTYFGKPTGVTYDAGLNFKPPWVNVTDIDATIQVEEYSTSDPISVKIGDGGESKIAVSYRWRINPDGADQVYADYRNSDLDITDAVRKALVSTNIKAALNEEFAKIDPLAGSNITSSMTPEQIAKVKLNVNPDYEALNENIKKNVEEKIKDLGDLIDIQSVTVTYFQLPDTTQSRINEFNAKIQTSKNALIDVSTKTAQARGNEELAKSLQDPNVLVSKCLDSLSDGDFTAPAGFSCWPGSGGSVVIPSR